MKKRMTDLFDDIPVEVLEDIMQTEQSEKRKSNNRRYIPRWAAAMIVVCILGLVGCAGYVVINYEEVFSKYFAEEDEKLPEELISNVQYRAENENYRIEVLSVLSDQEVKSILFSVEALNKESWKKMEKNGLVPKVFLNSSGGAELREYGEMEEEKWKKYFLYEGHFEDATEARIICGVSENGEPLNMYMTEDEIKEAGALSLIVPLETEEEKVITVRPENAVFFENAVLEEIRIFRMSIRMSGSGGSNNMECEEEEKHYPEIIVETKDGKKICLLSGNSENLTMEVDEIWGTGRASSGYRTEEGNETEFTQSIMFVQAFDIEQVEKIWVNGTNYPLT